LKALRKQLSVVLRQEWFVIKRFKVTCAALHEQKNDALGRTWKV
jgi:hypothetical protein